MNNPFFSQMISSKWAMEPKFLEQFVIDIFNLPKIENLEAIEVAAVPKTYNIINKKAVIEIKGILLKEVPFWLRWFGIDATSYVDIRNQVAMAINDNQVDGIHLRVDSPGGIVDGIVETADSIYAARNSKQVTATIEDFGASAAYWLASQAEIIDASRTTEVGSIGVYTVYMDSSKRADDLGIKVILVKSGEYKGMGVPGVEISDKQISAIQELIDGLANQFIDSVARGRGKEKDQIKELATGRLWLADQAKKLGLIDIVSKPQNKSNPTKKQKGDLSMEEKEKQELEAEKTKLAAEKEKAGNDKIRLEEQNRLSRLKEAFPDDLAFAVESFEKGKTVDQAKADYCDVLREKLKTSQQTTTDETETSAGATPLKTDDTDETGDGDFMAEARALAEEKKISVTAAMKLLARQKPQIYKVFREKCETDGKQMYAEAC